MRNRQTLIAVRLSFGVLALTAIAVQAATLAEADLFKPVNFLSYFTNLSNIFAGVVFILSALYLMRHRLPSPKDDIICGAATLYMAVTGAVYVALLSGEDLGALLPWVNIVLHYVMPLVVILDWLYQPPLSKLTVKQALLWLIFPATYLIYSLVRGPLVNWYPYPFLNPDKVGGYGGVALYCLAILVAFFALGWLLVKLGNRLKRNVS